MNAEPNVIIAVIIGFVIGAVVVWIINSSSKGKESAETNRLQKEYDAYRDQVNAHFAKTADAIDGLTKSYQQVFDHLSDGAQNLMDKESLQAQLEKRQGKAVTLAYLVDQNEAAQNKVSEIKQSSVVNAADSAKPKAAPKAASPAQTDSAAPEKPQNSADKPQSKPVAKPQAAKTAQPADAKAATEPSHHPDKPDVAAVKAEPVKVQAAAQDKAPQAAGADKPKPAEHIVSNDEHETAIESVKKHIKDDKGSKA